MSTEEEKGTEVQTLPAVVPAVQFEGIILDEKEPVKFTPQLIRDKSKDLLDLKIADIFDEAGLKAVKAARMKIVKTRTAIKAIEDEQKAKMKTKHDAEKKELTDYAETLYAACREGEEALQLKITTHENEKAAEVLKIANAKKAKTEGRNARMYELGMKFNGTGFMEYGKYIAQDVLHEMSDDKYAALLVEIEGLSMEQGVTGATPPAAAIPAPSPSQPVSSGGGWAIGAGRPVVQKDQIPAEAPKSDRLYETAIYSRAIPELGARLIITNGVIEPEPDAFVSNDRILESLYYVQIVR